MLVSKYGFTNILAVYSPCASIMGSFDADEMAPLALMIRPPSSSPSSFPRAQTGADRVRATVRVTRPVTVLNMDKLGIFKSSRQVTKLSHVLPVSEDIGEEGGVRPIFWAASCRVSLGP
jgi:hypothetical protein